MQCLKFLPKSLLDENGFLKKSILETLKFAKANKRDYTKKFLANEFEIDLKEISGNQFNKQMCKHLISPDVRCKIFRKISSSDSDANRNNLFRTVYDIISERNADLEFCENKETSYTYEINGKSFLSITAFARFSELLTKGKVSEQEIDQIIWSWTECHLLQNRSFGNVVNKSSIADQLDKHLNNYDLKNILTWEIEVFELPSPSRNPTIQPMRSGPSKQNSSQETGLIDDLSLIHSISWDDFDILYQQIINYKKESDSFHEKLTNFDIKQEYKDYTRRLDFLEKEFIAQLASCKFLKSEHLDVVKNFAKLKKSFNRARQKSSIKKLCSELELVDKVEDINTCVENLFPRKKLNIDELISKSDDLYEVLSDFNEEVANIKNTLKREVRLLPDRKEFIGNKKEIVRLFKIQSKDPNAICSLVVNARLFYNKSKITLHEQLGRKISELKILSSEKDTSSIENVDFSSFVSSIDVSKGISSLIDVSGKIESLIKDLVVLPSAKSFPELASEALNDINDFEKFKQVAERLITDGQHSTAFFLIRNYFYNNSGRNPVSKEYANLLFSLYLDCWSILASIEPGLMLEILHLDYQWIARIEKKLNGDKILNLLTPLHVSIIQGLTYNVISCLTSLAEKKFSGRVKDFEEIRKIGVKGRIGFYSSNNRVGKSEILSLSEIDDRFKPTGEIAYALNAIKHQKTKDLATKEVVSACKYFLNKLKAINDLGSLANEYEKCKSQINQFLEKAEESYLDSAISNQQKIEKLPPEISRKVESLLKKCFSALDDGFKYKKEKLSGGRVEINKKIEEIIEQNITPKIKFSKKKKSNFQSVITKIYKENEILLNDNNLFEYEFLYAFPEIALLMPNSCSQILDIHERISPNTFDALLREIADYSLDKSIKCLEKENCWFQIQRLPNLSDVKQIDFKERCEIFEQELLSKAEKKNFSEMRAKSLNELFQIGMHKVALGLFEIFENYYQKKLVEKEQLLKENFIGWSQRCQELKDSIEIEIQNCEEIDYKISIIKDVLFRKIRDSKKNKLANEKLEEDSTQLLYVIKNNTRIVESLSSYLPEEFYEDRKNPTPEIDEPFKDHSSQSVESLNFLIDGFDEESVIKIKEEFNKKWKSFSDLILSRFKMIRTETIWEVSKLNMPAARFRFRTPNCEYLSVNTVTIYMYPENEPIGYGERLKEQINDDKMNNTIPMCIVEKVSSLGSKLSNKKLILITPKDFASMLYDKKPMQAFKRHLFHNCSSPSDLHSISPFVSSDSIDDNVSFFHGRREKIDELLANSVSIICAGRRIGKSSLRKEVEKVLKKQNHNVVEFEITDNTSNFDENIDLQIAREITQGLLSTLPKDFALKLKDEAIGNDLEVMKHTLSVALKANFKVSILLDEFDRYLNHHFEKNSKNQKFPVIENLRAIAKMDRSKFKLLICGFKNLFYSHEKEERSQTGYALGNLGVLVKLDEWSHQEAIDFLSLTFEEHLGITVDDKVAQEIIKHSSSSPAFLQKFAGDLLISKFTKGENFKKFKNGQASVSNNDVWDTFESVGETVKDAFQDFVNTTLSWNLSGLGRVILLTILDQIKETCDGQKIKRKTADSILTRSYSKLDIKSRVKKWVDAASLKCNGKHLVLEDEEYDQTLNMLIMTNVLKLVTRDKVQISSPSYTRILGILEKNEKQEIDKEIEKFCQEKAENGLSHIFFN